MSYTIIGTFSKKNWFFEISCREIISIIPHENDGDFSFMTELIFWQTNFNRRCFKFYVERCYLKSAMPRHPSGYFYIETMAEKMRTE